ncbi:MAG: nickel pincer cofactor biosynthesis protein LarC [Cyanobacteria bacterium P01_D01_bin.105]
MKTLAYLDCPTGISGDMCLGALVHAGVPLAYLEHQLAQLGIADEFQLEAESVQRNQQAATKLHIKLTAPQREHTHTHENGYHHQHSPHQHSSHQHGSRRLPDIELLIQQADIPERAAAWSLAIFRLLAKAEARVHGIPPEKVHFHEVGATDAIVDIVGTCLGLDWLDVDQIGCSPLPTGGGTVRCEHGLLPVPAPAVLSMMATANIPVYGNGIEKELVTPTGCAIAAALCQFFGPPPRFTLQNIGLGAGGQDLALPNILRLWIGTDETDSFEKAQRSHPAIAVSGIKAPETKAPETKVPETKAPEINEPKTEEIVELQTQIDDCSPQAIAYTFNLLFTAGAVDVFSQPVTMKKNRLGTLLTVLCPTSKVADCEAILFQETTTLGIRRSTQQRTVLARKLISVPTDYGEITVKIAIANGKILNAHPEYDDCARAAQSFGVPLQVVQHAATQQLPSVPQVLASPVSAPL